VEAEAGSLVLVQPAASRKAVAKQDGTTILVIGGTPGEAYDPAPIEAGEAMAAYGKGDYDTAIAKQLIVVETRPQDAVAHFNVACFAARAGRADEAFEHLRKSVELNERIKELIRTDEDLDSIREDPRFAAFTK
jgi:tetratricopeptide (TPR) repeat protein